MVPVIQTKQSKLTELRCISCRKSYPLETHSVCKVCGSILSSEYDLSEPIDLITRENSMWQFREYLPPIEDSNIVSMGEGWTPLILASNFAKRIGLGSKNLLCKMEGQNPSGSFKDRPASLSVSLAKEWKKNGIFLASSGNAAAATAAYCARIQMNCLVLLKGDSTVSKLSQIAMYDPYLIRVKDLYKNADTLNRAFQLTQEALPEWINGFIWARHNPLLLDALKTITYEIVALNLEPDYVFVPTAGGDLIFGLYKGFMELKQLGQIKKIPKMVVVQGSHPAPTADVVEAATTKQDEDKDQSLTVAGALSSNMISDHGVFAARESEGFGVKVTNDEIIGAQRLVAKTDGIFCEASSAVTLAAVSKALGQGKIHGDDTVCALITGIGFKDYYPYLDDISQIPLADSSEGIKPVLSKMFQ